MTVSMTIRIDPAKVDRFMGSPGAPGDRFLATLANRVLNNSRARVNVDTGYLRSTGAIEKVAGEPAYKVIYRAHYARWVHEPSMSRNWSGNPFLTDALREEMSRL